MLKIGFICKQQMLHRDSIPVSNPYVSVSVLEGSWSSGLHIILFSPFATVLSLLLPNLYFLLHLTRFSQLNEGLTLSLDFFFFFLMINMLCGMRMASTNFWRVGTISCSLFSQCPTCILPVPGSSDSLVTIFRQRSLVLPYS